MVIKKNVEDVRQSPGRGRTVNYILWISVLLAAIALLGMFAFSSSKVDGPTGIVTPSQTNPSGS